LLSWTNSSRKHLPRVHFCGASYRNRANILLLITGQENLAFPDSVKRWRESAEE